VILSVEVNGLCWSNFLPLKSYIILFYVAIKLIAVPISSTKQQQPANADSSLPRAIRLNTTSQQVVGAAPLVRNSILMLNVNY